MIQPPIPSPHNTEFHPRTLTLPLTKADRLALEQYRRWHSSGVTSGFLWRKSWRIYVLKIILGAVAVALLRFLGLPSAGWMFGGFVGGAILRDFYWFRRSTRYWPLLAHIIDWRCVDELLSTQEVAGTHGQQSTA